MEINKSKKKDQVYLILGNSNGEVYEKTKHDENLKDQSFNFLHETGRSQEGLKEMIVKFRQNIKVEFLKRVFQIREWDIPYLIKENYSKMFHEVKKLEITNLNDHLKMMEPGISVKRIEKKEPLEKSEKKELRRIHEYMPYG